MATFAGTWLLPLFFLLAGSELRKEIVSGVFTKRKALLLPFFAAVFGVLIPFLIFIFITKSLGTSSDGWGVVLATDLPLVIIALRLLGQDISRRIRTYLLSIAIFDDLIAILIIALALNQNGIHPTVVAFILGILIPINFNNYRILKSLSEFLVLPIFLISTIWANWSPHIGLIALAVIIARIIGKPIGVLLGDFLARKSTGIQLLSRNEILAVGLLASLGLSVSLLFAQIAKASGEIYFAVLLTIPVAFAVISVAKRLAFRTLK